MEWKINKESVGLVGFKGIYKLDGVEHIIKLKIEEIEKGLQKHAFNAQDPKV